ncbi:unnamed protein product [Paramecium primaurelia]|uniref:Uncharacterized protein n=5 Tax=Paramecium TaxID=5884 RepID=A0C628_PARTE|nr:uncharacterized protein GSPATT00035374001 [Paramecium tetraurelia]CAD8106906.1 unnamed protein product [Paramecium primaurelia]CAD8108499.1 unnamed protein product [Paramecium sonneborni]CAD8182005.1 unnamed protein product [Paramecium octaurelia]CAD8203826.1 unnamed protein product [Paramecium pentaurelia]CAK66245.1 unnamed protein product [Paramecium tetraurelia]|eukprot:XP_001433642.1 hypothetical protein (macronuclear) [Paramecium tetraurelia strain d4-2]
MINKQTEQIFSQLQGAFAWVEKMRKKKPMTSDMQIKELLYFLNIDATNEEIEALNELANPEGEQDIQYEKLYKVFMNDQQQEQREVLEAFRLLSGSNRIEVDKLENWLYIYDKKYRNNTKQFIAQLKQSPSYKQGYLDFEKYVKEG